jgi:hypothetical protein
MWKDSVEFRDDLYSKYSDSDLNKLEHLFSIRELFLGCLPSIQYVSDTEFHNLIGISEYGKSMLYRLEIASEDDTDSDLALAAFLTFCHHDLLIDIDEIDVFSIEKVLDKQLRANNLRLPHRFGRTLYDRFNDNMSIGRLDHLTAQQIDELIQGTAQGVYQVGPLVTGPLGVIQSQTRRRMPPVHSLPLWHCADTGCQQLHHVHLLARRPRAFELTDQIRRLAKELDGPESEWQLAFVALHLRNTPEPATEFYDLAALIADAIPEPELGLVLEAALEKGYGHKLRSLLAVKGKDLDKGSSAAVVNKLNEEARLQLLLGLSDEDLLAIIDGCVKSRQIKIPPAEIRKARSKPAAISAFDTPASLSMFGLRTDRDYPTLFLASLVWHEYERIGQLADLAWRCQRGNAEDNPAAPLELMRTTSPREVLRTLVLPNRDIALSVAKRLNVELTRGENEEQILDVLLWKCGFDPPRYDDVYARMFGQLQHLREELLRHTGNLTEDDRDGIRSKGVNVFVTLERIIEEFVSFNVWLLSSDHFVTTRCIYNKSEAIEKVYEVIGPSVSVDKQQFNWNRAGGNVLGTLLLYARAASNWMGSLFDADSTTVARPVDQIPHYAGRDSRRFAFNHTALWADTARWALKEFTQEFDAVVSQLERSKLAEIRNGIDHYRDADRFPSLDDLLACESRVNAAIEAADVKRLLPKTYWQTARHVDNFGLSEREFMDYKGRKLVISGPASVSGIGTAAFDRPLIIPFGNLLGQSNAELMFTSVEKSSYSERWSNYPRRRDEGRLEVISEIHEHPESALQAMI